MVVEEQEKWNCGDCSLCHNGRYFWKPVINVSSFLIYLCWVIYALLPFVELRQRFLSLCVYYQFTGNWPLTQGRCFNSISIHKYWGSFNKQGFSIHHTNRQNLIFIFAPCIPNVKIPLLKPTDAHFCNYINSKNRLKLHYTLRHVSVRAGTILREFPRA
jgi:hypothetical protein